MESPPTISAKDSERFKPIIKRMAYKYACSILPHDPSLELDDLIGEGWVRFWELLTQEKYKRKFDHTFESTLTIELEGMFMNKYLALTTQKRTRPPNPIDAEIALSNFNWDKVEQIIDLKFNPSEAKRELFDAAKVLFQAPKELWDDLIPNNGRLSLDNLDKYLKKIKLWKAKHPSNPVITNKEETMACCVCEEEVKGAMKDSIHICSNCTQHLTGKTPQDISLIIQGMTSVGKTEAAEFISRCFLSQPKEAKLARRTPAPPTGILRRRGKNIKNKSTLTRRIQR